MVKVTSEVNLTNSLSCSKNGVENLMDYLESINEALETKDITLSTTINNSKLGTLKVRINNNGIEDCCDEISGALFKVNIEIIDERDNVNIDRDWYDELETNHEFIDSISKVVSDYVNSLNDVANKISHPVNEYLAFINGRLFMEISEYNHRHTPEYVSFSIDADIDTTEFVMNIYACEE